MQLRNIGRAKCMVPSPRTNQTLNLNLTLTLTLTLLQKRHAVVSIQLNKFTIVACPMYPEKFVTRQCFCTVLPLSLVIVTAIFQPFLSRLSVVLKCDIWWQYFNDFPDNQLPNFLCLFVYFCHCRRRFNCLCFILSRFPTLFQKTQPL